MRTARYYVRSRKNTKIGNVEIPAEIDKEDAVEVIREEAINIWHTRCNSSEKGHITFAYFRNVRDRLAARSLVFAIGVRRPSLDKGTFSVPEPR